MAQVITARYGRCSLVLVSPSLRLIPSVISDPRQLPMTSARSPVSFPDLIPCDSTDSSNNRDTAAASTATTFVDNSIFYAAVPLPSLGFCNPPPRFCSLPVCLDHPPPRPVFLRSQPKCHLSPALATLCKAGFPC